MGRTVIYFTRELPGLSEELSQGGFQVYEALAISEVFYLVEQHPNAYIVVDHTVEEDAAREAAKHYSTLRLIREATAADVLWGLSSWNTDGIVQ